MSELKLSSNTGQTNISSNITAKKSFINKIFGNDGFNFKDVLDLINPLHHIPLVGTVYRSITNDKIAPAIKLAGGALFGGAAGAGLAAIGLVANKNKASKPINIDNNSYYSNRNNLDSNTISIGDLMAERRLPSSNIGANPNFTFTSNIPSVSNYLSFVSLHQKKLMADALQVSPKRKPQNSDIQRPDTNKDFLKTRIDRRL